LAVVVPTQAPGKSAPRGFTLSAAEGASPAAQALSSKKPTGFLQLFRKIAGAGNKGLPAHSRQGAAAAEASLGKDPARGKAQASENDEFRAQAKAARAGARPRRGGKARPVAWLQTAALPAPARRTRGSEPQEAASSPAVEARSAARPAQARVFVVDLRVRPAAGQRQPAVRAQAAVPERDQGPRSFDRALPAREAGSAAPAGPLSGFPPTSLSSYPAPGSPSSVPASALRERLLPEIVRQAGIILRDGGEGEIRLVLKPEHLGSVRIRLQLGESSLEGRIVVDNSNVKELLDAHLEQLKSALRQEGYASANIDVTVSGGGDGRRDPPPEPALPAASGRTAGQFERATPGVLDLGFTTVNLLA